jgi:hypothetical protein
MQEYVPFQPYVEGPYLVVLHIAKTLPHYIAAAAAAAGVQGNRGGVVPSPSPLSAVFGSLSATDAAAAARMTGDPAGLGKLKRDLFFRWVRRVACVSEHAAHGLFRRMFMDTQGRDIPLLLPVLLS